MMKIAVDRTYLPAFAILLILFLQTGCTKTETGSRVTSVPEPAVVESAQTGDTKVLPLDEKLEEIYDIDKESLEDDDIGEVTEVLGKPEKTDPGTFSVKDINEEVPAADQFAKGYRVQVFASADLEKAKEFKKKIMAGTGLAVYIDYESALYKVRVGDFVEREEASDARIRLAEQYPDCWIVKTTIKK